MNPDQDPSKRRPSLLQVIASVAASFFGVQSSKNRERDFKQGKATHFIAIGIVLTVVFILKVVILVQVVLKAAAH